MLYPTDLPQDHMSVEHLNLSSAYSSFLKFRLNIHTSINPYSYSLSFSLVPLLSIVILPNILPGTLQTRILQHIPHVCSLIIFFIERLSCSHWPCPCRPTPCNTFRPSNIFSKKLSTVSTVAEPEFIPCALFSYLSIPCSTHFCCNILCALCILQIVLFSVYHLYSRRHFLVL